MINLEDEQVDPTENIDPSEADRAAAGDKAAETDDEQKDSEEDAHVQAESSKSTTDAIPTASNVVTLFFAQPVSVSINGKTWESETINQDEHVLTVPANLEQAILSNLFDAHGITPLE